MLTAAGLFSSALDPLIGVAGDTRGRRAVVLAGGVAFAGSAALVAVSLGFWTLLAALLLGYAGSSGFVSLAQATLMDLDPARRERNMAWWTLAGSCGYVGGPLLIAAVEAAGLGWRAAFVAFAALTLPLVLAARRFPSRPAGSSASLRESAAGVRAALRSRDVLRWLVVLEAVDLLLDVFFTFLAVYLVDVVGVSPATAALGIAAWTGAGLAGDALLVRALRRFDGLRWLRATAVAALAAYPAFLVVPGLGAKLALAAVLGLLDSGWYAIPKARLYEALPGQSGAAVAAGGFAGLAGELSPLLFGAAAAAFGLGSTMWALLLAPIALLALVPRRG